MYARLASSIRPVLVGFREGRFFSGRATDGRHDISRSETVYPTLDIRGRLLSELKTAMKVRCSHGRHHYCVPTTQSQNKDSFTSTTLRVSGVVFIV
jgi:hypothetical protein